MSRKPILSWNRFKEAHEKALTLHRRYATGRGRSRVTDAAAQTLKKSSALLLYATSAPARLLVGKAIKTNIPSLTRGPEFKRVHFVTLTPAQFAMPLRYAQNVDVEILKEWATQAVGTGDLIGFIEAGFYSNFGLPAAPDQPTVSWHAHILVWNVDEAYLVERIDRLNRLHRAFIPGFPCAHQRSLSQGRVLGRLFYMAKAPLDDHRVYPVKRVVSGRASPMLTGEFVQKKRPLRPGQAMSLVPVFSALRLPDLVFSRGAGNTLRDRIFAPILAARAMVREA